MTNPIHTPGFAQVAGMTAAQVCERFELSAEGAALLSGQDTPERLFSLLRDQGLDEDAVRLVAHSQPSAELIRWALSCVKLAYEETARGAERGALDAVETWTAQPTDAHRKAAYEASEKAKLDNPPGCLAAAVFFTGGNIAPPEAGQETPAPAGVAAQLASAAILLAASHGDPAAARGRMDLFLGIRK
jgi:hypothetical protein